MVFLKWDPPTFSSSIWFIQHTWCHYIKILKIMKILEILHQKQRNIQWVLHELLNHVWDFQDQENVPHICNYLLEELILDLVSRGERCHWILASWESSFYAFSEVIHTYFKKISFFWNEQIFNFRYFTVWGYEMSMEFIAKVKKILCQKAGGDI